MSQAATATVRDSAATRSATPARKRLKAMLLHPAIERGARQPERAGGATDISLICLQHAGDGVLLDCVQARRVRGGRRGRRLRVPVSRGGEGKIGSLEYRPRG